MDCNISRSILESPIWGNGHLRITGEASEGSIGQWSGEP